MLHLLATGSGGAVAYAKALMEAAQVDASLRPLLDESPLLHYVAILLDLIQVSGSSIERGPAAVVGFGSGGVSDDQGTVSAFCLYSGGRSQAPKRPSVCWPTTTEGH